MADHTVKAKEKISILRPKVTSVWIRACMVSLPKADRALEGPGEVANDEGVAHGPPKNAQEPPRCPVDAKMIPKCSTLEGK